jgi:flavodoxin
MRKILVIYYSRTGTTQALAEEIARACDAEWVAINAVAQHRGIAGYIRSAVEAALHLNTPIQVGQHAPRNYDLVVVGTPIWFWNVASPVRTYLKKNRRQFRQLAFFCTYGGSGQRKVLADLAAICEQTAVATWAVSDKEIATGTYRESLAKFVAGIQRSHRWRGTRRRSQRIR